MCNNRIVYLNLGNSGSTGTIIRGISEKAKNEGYDTFFCYPDGKRNVGLQKNDYIIGNNTFQKINQKLTYYTGLDGCFAVFSTISLLRYINVVKPNIIHLHNIHNSYINLPMVFNYIKKHNIKMVWTLHDCWAFTGHCPHFISIGCDKWRSGCFSCPKYREYPHMLIDSSKMMWSKKRKWFTGIDNLTIVTPSKWLASLAKESYLCSYTVNVINNGIDLKEFKPTKSSFKEKHGITKKKVLLGVAFDWSSKKGLDEFNKLAEELSNEYSIVLVGLDNSSIWVNPKIITIKRTSSKKELAEIYSMADLFINPTYEDNFPTVNIEALACGTPVITYDTGGAKEMLNSSCGMWVKTGDYPGLKKGIYQMIKRNISTEECLSQANLFDKNDKFREYIALYQNEL